MDERFQREALLIGEEGVARLSRARVAVFGVGGVGSYASEALARCGVGHVELIDNDAVSVSNINRQLCALDSTVGQPKVSVMAARMRDINPQIEVTERQEFFLPECRSSFDFSRYDFVIDAIDTVAGKLAIVESAKEAGVPMISCMGTGNKCDPTALTVTDIYKTSTCPLARVMRRELKKRGVKKLSVVYSEEPVMEQREVSFSDSAKPLPGSLSFVPPVAGFIAASEAVKTILGQNNRSEKESHE